MTSGRRRSSVDGTPTVTGMPITGTARSCSTIARTRSGVSASRMEMPETCCAIRPSKRAASPSADARRALTSASSTLEPAWKRTFFSMASSSFP